MDAGPSSAKGGCGFEVGVRGEGSATLVVREAVVFLASTEAERMTGVRIVASGFGTWLDACRARSSGRLADDV